MKLGGIIWELKMPHQRYIQKNLYFPHKDCDLHQYHEYVFFDQWWNRCVHVIVTEREHIKHADTSISLLTNSTYKCGERNSVRWEVIISAGPWIFFIRKKNNRTIYFHQNILIDMRRGKKNFQPLQIYHAHDVMHSVTSQMTLILI